MAPIPAAVFGVNAADAAWVDRICVPQALATFTQPVRFTGREREIGRRVYVVANRL